MKTVISKININQNQVIKALSLLIILMIFTYIYLVNTVAFNVAERQNIVESISVIQSQISDLELVMTEKKQEITREMVDQLGLVATNESERIFVLRDRATRLTLNE